MDELAKRIAELSERYGPAVVDAARAAAQTEAYSSLASSVIMALLAVVFFFVGRSLWRRSSDPHSDFDEDIAGLLGGILLTVSIIPACAAIWAWIDPWTWTAISHPDLWIAKKVLKL